MNPLLLKSYSQTIWKGLQDVNGYNNDYVIEQLSRFIEFGTQESILLGEICCTIYKSELKSKHIDEVLHTLFRKMIVKPHFCMVFTHLVRHTSMSHEYLDALSSALQLSACEKTGFALTLFDSTNNDVRTAGRNLCISQCQKLCDAHESIDTATDGILDVLSFLEQSELLSKYVDSFMQMILQVWLNANSCDMLGPQCSTHFSELDFHLTGHIKIEKEARAAPFANMLGSWNKLAKCCQKLRENGSPLQADVAFSLLMSCYKSACQDPFPLAVVCGNVWENTEAQLFFLKHAISATPDVFTFSHCGRQLEYSGVVSGHELQPWLCLNLLEVLCALAEKSNATYVRSLLEFPLKNFPEVLLRGIAHVVENFLDLPLLRFDPENVNRAVELLHELEILSSVMNVVPMSLRVIMAIVASHKNFIILKEWLKINSSTYEHVFFEECVKVLKEVKKRSPEMWSVCRMELYIFYQVLQMQALSLTSPRTLTRIGRPLSIETLLAASNRRAIKAPPSETQKKIFPCIIDFVTDENIEVKAKAIRGILEEGYYPWFAQFFVMAMGQREPDIHMRYINFLKKIGSKKLDKQIVQETYLDCKVILESDRIKFNDEELSLLKNLGSWLGKITIGRNQPLLQKHIDPKALLVEAYEKGSLRKVIPFISKVLEPGRSSLGYKPPNPWTMGIFELLAEIFAMKNLGMSLQYEIEYRLFRSLNVDIKKVTPSSLLKDRVRIIEGNPDFNQGPSQQHVKEVESTVTSYQDPGVQIFLEKLELMIANDAKEAEIQLLEIILKSISKEDAALAVANKVFECLYEDATNIAHADACLTILAAICDIFMLVRKEITSWVLHSDDCDRKFNTGVVSGLIRRKLLNLAEYSLYIAKLIDKGKNGSAKEFATSLVQALETSDAIYELHHVVESLAKVTKDPVGNTDDNGTCERDPHNFRAQVSEQLSEWCRIRSINDDAACSNYVLKLHKNVLSKPNNRPQYFFHILLELAVSHYVSFDEFNQHGDHSCFLVIDIYTDLVFSIFKFDPRGYRANKLSIFSEVLEVIVRFIRKDEKEKKASFDPRPYVRMFVNFFAHLDSVVNTYTKFQILKALSNCFYGLLPQRVPEFRFAWVELVGHKYFLPKMLTGNDQIGWRHFHLLLINVLQFMEPLLRIDDEPKEPVHRLYKGILKVLLLLSEDFPEFLCYYYFSLCHVIPPHCVEMRNIILSAFPQKMRLPDPSNPNLKMSQLQPCILPTFGLALEAKDMKKDVDSYMMERPEESLFLSNLNMKLLLSSSKVKTSGSHYNVPLLNSLVLYVGTKAIEQLLPSTTNPHDLPADFFPGACLDIFKKLIQKSEGRYLFFNAVANHLRYPNNHTYYFSFLMLHFFTETKQEEIKEQIASVLLKRLIIKPPHPWGVKFTFLELVKNPRYKFWKLKFTKNNPNYKSVLMQFQDIG